MTTFGQSLDSGEEFYITSSTDSSSGNITALASAGKSYIRLTGANSLQGIANGVADKVIIIENVVGSGVTIDDEATGATAANRIRTGLNANFIMPTNSSIILTYDGTLSRWVIAASGVQGPAGAQGAQGSQGATGIVPTQQIFTSSSGTYTKPAGTLWLRVRMVGGGGGGGGGGANQGGSGGTGGNSTFGTSFLTANGGVGGDGESIDSSGGAGGTASLAAGATGIAMTGSYGASGQQVTTPTGIFLSGGNGGTSPFGGAGGGAYGQAGFSAATNSGSGGGGGAKGGSADDGGGGGGGAGGYIDVLITSPSSSYSYAVGAAGTAGSAGGGVAGGTGGSGYIIVEEHYS